MDVFPRVLVQRVRRLRAGLSFFTSGLLRDGRGLLADVAPLEGPSVPVNRLETEKSIRRMTGEDIGQRRRVQVREHDDADTVGGEEGYLRRETVDVAAVVHALLPAVRLDDPAKSVPGLLDLRIVGQPREGLNDHLRLVHVLDLSRRHDAFAPNRAATEIQLQPLRHVVDAGVDRAGRPHRVDDPERNVAGLSCL